VALLVLATVFVSVTAFAVFIFFKVKQEEEGDYARTVESLGALMGERILNVQEEIKKDMTGILALVNPSSPDREVEALRIILQKNPVLLYFELARLAPEKNGHGELVSLFNENALVKESVDKGELRRQIEEDINAFASRQGEEINYHFESRPGQFPIYIFELDIRRKIYAAFALTKDVFTRFYNPATPADVILLNGENNVLFASRPEENFPARDFAAALESSSNQGVFEKYRATPDASEFAVHFYRAADGVTLLTFKNLTPAGLDRKSFEGDVLFFFGAVSAIMLLISFAFSKGLSVRLQKLMGLTEKIAAGQYHVGSDLRARDEVGDLADHFRRLGEHLVEKDTRMERVTELATRDGLTGVYNRRYFHERLEEAFEETRRTRRPMALILLDIDRYKHFNDEYGHQQGDIVIQQLAHLLTTFTRKNDLVARYGGDEFAVILRDAEPEVALVIAERIREAFEQRRISRSGGSPLSGTCSLGVASFDGQNLESPDELIKKADDFLYTAKRGGRNQVQSEI
jgi:diguanylate cyclase (GGDEF)-like protein